VATVKASKRTPPLARTSRRWRRWCCLLVAVANTAPFHSSLHRSSLSSGCTSSSLRKMAAPRGVVRAAFDLGSGGIKVVVAEVAPLFDGAGAAGRVRVTQVRCVAGGLGTYVHAFATLHALSPSSLGTNNSVASAWAVFLVVLGRTTQWPVHGRSFWSCSVEQLSHVHAFATLDGVIPWHHSACLQSCQAPTPHHHCCQYANLRRLECYCVQPAVARGTTYTPRTHFNKPTPSVTQPHR
jgi:hypothetical protein